MKLHKFLHKFIGNNEIVALWFETDQNSRVLYWRGSAWKIPKECRKWKVSRVYGTIPESICQADTINIIIKHEPIKVCCETCANRKTMRCPNHSECAVFVRKPHWEWNKTV